MEFPSCRQLLYETRAFHGSNYEDNCFLECDAVYPEDGGSRFLRNIGEHLPDYTVSHPRRQAGSVSYKASQQVEAESVVCFSSGYSCVTWYDGLELTAVAKGSYKLGIG
jgi:hypothetical protein